MTPPVTQLAMEAREAPLLLFVAAQGCGRRRAGFEASIEAAMGAAEKRGESQPDYRVFVGKVEIGAGGVRTGKGSGREFVSVKVDDPSFAAPICANLVERDGQHELIWSR